MNRKREQTKEWTNKRTERDKYRINKDNNRNKREEANEQKERWR